jgi:hypothetical protein
MPNWVDNKIHIHGNAEQRGALEEIIAILSAPYKDIDNGDVNFLNLIAPPDDEWEAYNCGNIPVGGEAEKSPYNWYRLELCQLEYQVERLRGRGGGH